MTQVRYWSIALIYLVGLCDRDLRSQPDQRLADGAPTTLRRYTASRSHLRSSRALWTRSRGTNWHWG